MMYYIGAVITSNVHFSAVAWLVDTWYLCVMCVLAVCVDWIIFDVRMV